MSDELKITGTLLVTGIESPIFCKFLPFSDITAWELAQIIPYLLGKPMYQSDWDALGTANNHLVRM